MNTPAKRKISPKIFIGVEFEGILNRCAYDTLCDYLYSLNHYMVIGQDASIRGYSHSKYYGIEIRTPKLPYKQGLQILEDIICFLQELSYAGLFKTNNTCGLHINISESYSFRTRENREKFYSFVLSEFKESEMLRLYRRSNNRYCLPLNIPEDIKSDVSKIQNYIDNHEIERDGFINKVKGFKYLAASLREPTNRVNSSRLEFRYLGNTGYQLKTDKLKISIDHIKECVDNAFQQTIN
jgi:hypothetical protein